MPFAAPEGREIKISRRQSRTLIADADRPSGFRAGLIATTL